MRLWLGPIFTVFIADAENVEIIMKSKDCLTKPDAYKIVRDAIGSDGLFTSSGKHIKITGKKRYQIFVCR